MSEFERFRVSGILLSICLPNYNQGTALKRTIENLKCVPSNSQIEFLLSDNGSTELASIEAVEIARQDLNGVRILTGEASIKNNNNWLPGLGANLNRLVQHSNGEYVWFIGSGDLINVDYLPRVIEILASRKYENLIIASETYTSLEELSQYQLRNSKYKQEKFLSLIVDSKEELFDNSISCNITKRTVFDPKRKDFTFQNSWPHIEHFMNYVCNSKSFQVGSIREKILLIDQPENGWFTEIEAINLILNLGLLLSKFAEDYPASQYKFNSLLASNNFFQTNAILIHLRISSQNTAKGEPKLIKEFLLSMNLLKRVYLLIVLKCPYKMIRIVRRINSLFLRENRN
jgi:glycosyltransferase involved in cell wall biosynthesis